MLQRIIKIIKYLTLYEWIALGFAIALTTSLPIIFGLVTDQSTISYALGLTVTIFALMGAFFAAKGRMIAILFDVIAVTCNGLNLALFAGASAQVLLGYTLLGFVLPAFCIQFLYWKRRQKEGIVQGRGLGIKGWSLTLTIWITLSMIIFISRWFTGQFLEVNEIEWTNKFIECFSVSSIFVGMTLYVFVYKESWTFWAITILLNMILFSTNYAIMNNPMALISLITLNVELCLAMYGLYKWKKTIKNKTNSNFD